MMFNDWPVNHKLAPYGYCVGLVFADGTEIMYYRDVLFKCPEPSTAFYWKLWTPEAREEKKKKERIN